jgi:predicted branched-subunit amino acid permease
VPFGIAVFAIAISFGVLARPVMGLVAPIVMSVVVFSGAAQFGALAVLALAPSLRGRTLSRAAFAMTTVDASWAAASTGDGTFDPWFMVGASIPQYVGWIFGTVIGVFIGGSLGNPDAYGLEALFPAFFISLLFEEVHDRRRAAAALGGAAIALVLTPLVPAGLPILAAVAAAIVVARVRP